jgi:hypothetical protein
MLIIPKLDDIQVDILKIIESHKFNNQIQIENILNYVSNIPQCQGYDDNYKQMLAGEYVLHLYSQGLISKPSVIKTMSTTFFGCGTPIMLTSIAYGYLETTIKIEELIDTAISRMSISLGEQKTVRTKLISQVKDLGIDFLIKLIVESIKNSY